MPGLPPFQGGAAGYIGYDYGAVLERLPRTRFDDLAIPDVMLGLYDWVIAWDHRVGTAWIVSTGLPESGAGAGARGPGRGWTWCGSACAGRPRAGAARHGPRGGRGRDPPEAPVLPGARASRAPSRSGSARPSPTAAISTRSPGCASTSSPATSSRPTSRSGSWRRCASRRSSSTAGSGSATPPPFAAYLDFGELPVLSASPERFLRLDETAGTSRPGRSRAPAPAASGPMHDAALGRALAESEKDRAENVMIVDLLRNDLSRVCRPGTVRVPELFALEHHPTVHHLVSTVVGELDPGADAVDLLRAAFPGGSITGAPKVRAMEIIAELEPTRAGCTAGRSATSSTTGAMDTSIVIRTYLALRGRVYFQAGGGIVADSDPELEYRETLDKARALIGALARPMILLIDNYDSFVYNLARYVRELGETPVVRRHDALTVDEVAAMAPVPHHHLARALLARRGGDLDRGGAPARRHDPDPRRLPGPPVHRRGVRRRDRPGRPADARQDLADPPPGHGHLPRPAHAVPRDPLSLAGDRPGLGAGRAARSTATSEDGEIMAVQHVEHPVHGVQFHPESVLTEHGYRLVDHFLHGVPATPRALPLARRRGAGAAPARSRARSPPIRPRWTWSGDHRVHRDVDGAGRRDQLRAHGRGVGRGRRSCSSRSSRRPRSGTCARPAWRWSI